MAGASSLSHSFILVGNSIIIINIINYALVGWVGFCSQMICENLAAVFRKIHASVLVCMDRNVQGLSDTIFAPCYPAICWHLIKGEDFILRGATESKR